MDQLSGADYVSLFAEKRNVYNHVATLSIYDVSAAPGGKVRFKDILKHFQDRLFLHPVFRRRLVLPPLGIDRPYWSEDADIDVEFHIRHIRLPAPGDWRQLMIQVARLHSRPLDRSQPLWEAYVIEGLDNIPKLPPGAFAVFLKIHHAVVDGMAAIHLISQLHAPLPAEGARKLPAIYVDRTPLKLEFAAKAVGHAVQRVGKFASVAARLAQRGLQHGPDLLSQFVRERKLTGSGQKAPHTRFSKRVSPHRVVEGFGMPLSRIRRIRAKVPGATLNDVFIAVAGGGVRKYLELHGELPAATLTGLMPISLRSDGAAGGNDVAGVPVPVHSDIADPIARLHAVHRGAAASKAQAEAMGLDLLKNLFDVLPPLAVNLIIEKSLVPSLNMTVSNVRGPDQAMYLAGAKAMCLYPVSIPADGAALNVTGVSYNGVMWVSTVSCRTMVPDPDVLVGCLREAFNELLAAADALGNPPAQSGSAADNGTRKRKSALVGSDAPNGVRRQGAAKTGGSSPQPTRMS